MGTFTIGFEARVRVKTAQIDATQLKGRERFTMDFYPIVADVYKFVNEPMKAGATVSNADFRWFHYTSLARAFSIWGVGKDRQDTWIYRLADAAQSKLVDTPTTKHMAPMVGSRYVAK